jgi:CheY-like chemotaxis protein
MPEFHRGPCLLPEAFSQPDLPKQKEQLPSTEEFYSRLQSINILIVEDMELNQKILLMQLEQLKLKADVVRNGRQALKAFKAKDYQLIFMDCQMPGMDGYEASQQIRLMEAAPNYSKKPVFITAMTANVEEDDVAKCFQSGINYYLSKPLRLEDVEKFFRYFVSRTSDAPPQTSVPGKTAASKPAPDTQLEPKHPESMPLPSAETIEFSPEDFDMSTLNTLRSLRHPGKPDPLTQSISFFNQDASKGELALRKAVVALDWDNIRLYAHGIKGICMNLGAMKAGNLFMQIEKKRKRAYSR